MADVVEVIAPEDGAPGAPPQLEPDTLVVPRTRRPVVAGALAGAWALLVGLALVTCLVMLTWAISPRSVGDSAAAWNAAGTVWLGAHLVPLTVSGQSVSLLPIGGLLLGLLLTRRSGAWTGRLLPEPTAVEAAWIVAGAALVYGAGAAGIAWLSMGPSASARPAQAFLVTGLVAALGALWGVAPEAGLVPALRDRVTDAVWRTLTAGLTAVVGLFGAGAVLVTISLLASYGLIARTLSGLDGGPVGALGLTLLGALSLPNLDVWAMSVVAGPGVHVGAVGGLSAFGGDVGTLPALPVLAGIPADVPGWTPVLLLVPVLLGAFAGRIRWGRDLPTARGALVAAAGLGAVVAPLVAGLALLSSGSLGGGRLADVGPPTVPVTLAATGLIVLGFLAEAASQFARLSWELRRASQRASSGPLATTTADTRVDGVDGGEPGEGSDDWLTDSAGLPGDGDGGSRPRWTAVPDLFGAGAAVTGRVVGVGSAAISVVGGAGAAVGRRATRAGSTAVAGAGAVGATALARVAGTSSAVLESVRPSHVEEATDPDAPGVVDHVDAREHIDLRDGPAAEVEAATGAAAACDSPVPEVEVEAASDEAEVHAESDAVDEAEMPPTLPVESEATGSVAAMDQVAPITTDEDTAPIPITTAQPPREPGAD